MKRWLAFFAMLVPSLFFGRMASAYLPPKGDIETNIACTCPPSNNERHPKRKAQRCPRPAAPVCNVRRSY